MFSFVIMGQQNTSESVHVVQLESDDSGHTIFNQNDLNLLKSMSHLYIKIISMS